MNGRTSIKDSGGSNRFLNVSGGVVRVYGSPATIEVPFDFVDGRVELKADRGLARLRLNGGGMSVGSGTFILDEETELSFNRGVHSFFGTYRMQGKGTVEAFADRLRVITGTLRSELTSDLGLQLNGATVEISAGAELVNERSGIATWSCGSIVGRGVFRNKGEGEETGQPLSSRFLRFLPSLRKAGLTIDGDPMVTLEATLANEGVIVHERGTDLMLGPSGRVVNQNIDGRLSIYLLRGGINSAPGGRIVNGPFTFILVDGLASIINAEVDNQGFIAVLFQSTATLSGPVTQFNIARQTLSGGTWLVEDGATLTLGTGQIITENRAKIGISGTGRFTNLPQPGANSIFTNKGTFSLLDAPAFALGATFENFGETRITNSTVAVAGDLDNREGMIDIEKNSHVTVSGFAVNEGTITLSGGSRLSVQDSLETSGNLDVGPGCALDVLKITPAKPSTFRTTGGNITINGTVKAGNYANDGGSFGGTGTITGQKFDNRGVLKPGCSPGVLTINADYTQFPEGTLEIEVGGTLVGEQHGQLVVNGNVALGGTIVFKFIDGFAPRAGDRFDSVVAAGTLAGRFETARIVNLAPGFEFEVTDDGGTVCMTALTDGVYTPPDCDQDGDVDLPDLLALALCFTGPEAGPVALECSCSDLDNDNDVDLADLIAFQAAFTGAR